MSASGQGPPPPLRARGPNPPHVCKPVWTALNPAAQSAPLAHRLPKRRHLPRGAPPLTNGGVTGPHPSPGNPTSHPQGGAKGQRLYRESRQKAARATRGGKSYKPGALAQRDQKGRFNPRKRPLRGLKAKGATPKARRSTSGDGSATIELEIAA